MLVGRTDASIEAARLAGRRFVPVYDWGGDTVGSAMAQVSFEVWLGASGGGNRLASRLFQFLPSHHQVAVDGTPD
jgi:hypothetical protein